MNVIIFGGTSAVASKVAYYFAINHDNVLISSRNFADGLALVNHLKLISGNQNINNFQFDALDYDYKKPMLSEMVKEYFEPDLVLIAYGTLTENKLIQNNLVKIRNELDINLFSIIGLCTEFASYFEQKKSLLE